LRLALGLPAKGIPVEAEPEEEAETAAKGSRAAARG
jgi:hypothetical protein